MKRGERSTRADVQRRRYRDDDGGDRIVYIETPVHDRRNDGGSGGVLAFLLGIVFVIALGAFGFALFGDKFITPPPAQAESFVTATPSPTAVPSATPVPTSTPEPTPRPAIQQRPPVAAPQPQQPYNPPQEAQQPAPPVDPTVCAITDDVPQSNVCGPRSQAEALKAQSMMIANQVLGGNVVEIVTQVPTE